MGSDSRLNKLVRATNRPNASFKVSVKAEFYRNSARIFKADTPYDKLQPGMKQVRLKINPPTGLPSTNDNTERSIRRTKKIIRGLGLSNKFDLFVTFTFSTDRKDEEKCRQKLRDWLRNESKRKGKFEYLIVPERHHDGALHFHGLLEGYQGNLKESINLKTGKPLKRKGRQRYTLKSYQSGFTDAVKIGDTSQDREAVVSYLCKYITKEMLTVFGSNRYWASHGLKRPFVMYNPPYWYESLTPRKVIKVDGGIIGYYDIDLKDEKLRAYLKEITDVISAHWGDD